MSSPVPAASAPPAPPVRSGSGLRASIRRRPLVWFFVLAYALSWIAWVPYVLSENGVGVWDFTFPGGAAGGQLGGVLPGAYLGPITSALLIIGLTEGRAGLRTWRRRMTRFRVSVRWYLLVVLAVPLALAVGSMAVTGDTPSVPSGAVLVAFLPGLVAQLITTGLAEEPGWREFAMPRMQSLVGPLKATGVVGVLWGCWHLPLFLTEWGGGPDVSWTEPVEFVVSAVLFSAVMTWVFNASGESMPLVMLLHCGVNNSYSVVWDDLFPGITRQEAAHGFLVASFVGAVIAVVATRGRLGLPRTADAPLDAAPKA